MSTAATHRFPRVTGLFLLLAHAAVSHAGPGFAPGVSLGTYRPVATETSGMAASVVSPDVLYSQSDSGDGARFYALSKTGERLGTYAMTGASNDDYEDMAVGPGPVEGVQYVYVGDIGDNSSNRLNITVYRVPEPAVYLRQAAAPVSVAIPNTAWRAINLVYPGLPFLSGKNAETLMVDPRNGDLLVGTKEDNICRIFTAPAAVLDSGTTITMTQIANVPFDVASAGCISPAGTELILRRETFAQLWRIAPGQSILNAMLTAPVTIPTAAESNGEAVTFEKNGSGYLTLSEGASVNVWYFARTSNDGPLPEITLVPPEAIWRYRDDGSDQGTAWRSSDFDDAGWSSGPAQFGFGEGDEQTVISFGENASQKHRTTYFRHQFTVDTGVRLERFVLRVLYEGGIAAYLNGTEVLRRALPPDAGATTLATGTRGAVKFSWLSVNVDPSLLNDGVNTLAVETHLATPTQSDLSFDLQLEGALPFFTLAVEENDPDGGMVFAAPGPNAPGAMQYLSGTQVSLTAQAEDGYALKHWLDFDPAHPGQMEFAAELHGNPLLVAMERDRVIRAIWQIGTGEGQAEGEGAAEGMNEGAAEAEGGAEGATEGEAETAEGSLEGSGGEGAAEGVAEGQGEGSGDGAVEGTAEGEGGAEGTIEGTAEAEGGAEGEAEGEAETAEGSPEGSSGEGGAEGVAEGEGEGEGGSEGAAEGDGEEVYASADQNRDGVISLSELLRVIQFFNSGGYHCAMPPESSEDGYVPGASAVALACIPHSSDYSPQDWRISLSELLRLIQFFNSGGYRHCPEANPPSEDGFCPGTG